MPKNVEDIIVPERKRSIRDIPIPEGRRREERVAASRTTEHPVSRTPAKKSPGKRVWLASGATLVILIFVLLSIFDGATLAYVPKSATLTFDNDTYTAEKTGDSGLLYSVVKLSKDKGLDAPASGAEKVERKAFGTIIVYNKTNSPQRFRATTRFQTPEGKTYQVQDTIVVPARKVADGVEVPGTLEVKVYGERPGDEYNIGLTDFTLPGLKGTALFSSVYARSKTEMTGGFVGEEKVVTSGDKSRIKVELESALRDELAAEARAQVPEDFILFPSLSSIVFKDLPQTDSLSDDAVMVNMRGDLYAIMFKRSDLSNHLAGEKIALTPDESVNIVALDALNLTFVGETSVNLLNGGEIKFSVTGEALALWNTDEVALKADLVGKSKKDIPTIINNYSTIASATTTLRPFWKRSFPSDSTRISIKELSIR